MKDLGLLFYIKEEFYTSKCFTLLTLSSLSTVDFLTCGCKFESVTLQRPPVPNTLGFILTVLLLTVLSVR